MTDVEYQVLDELYFVSSFSNLLAETRLPEKVLSETLSGMLSSGLVRAFFPDPDTEIAATEPAIRNNLIKCFFLASKAGLLAHNTR